jgi:hypothetical protein
LDEQKSQGGGMVALGEAISARSFSVQPDLVDEARRLLLEADSSRCSPIS